MRSKILPVYALIGLIAAIVCGFFPNPASHADPALFIYETGTVLIVSGLMTVQTVLLMAILRPATYSNSWGRALLALIVSFVAAALGAIGSMHQPPAWGAYAMWVLVMFLTTFMMTWISALGAFLSRKR
jgi:uncharacterized protein (DUF2062 family)